MQKCHSFVAVDAPFSRHQPFLIMSGIFNSDKSVISNVEYVPYEQKGRSFYYRDIGHFEFCRAFRILTNLSCHFL